jgi:hypothetical protein
MELTSKQKGNLTELQCLTAFYQQGCHVSIPYGENCRYDFILDVEGKLLRIQVKTSKAINDDCFSFATRSTRINSQGNITTTYTKNEIDYFATFYNGKCYLVPVEECGTEKTLRYNYPSNGQKKGIYLAQDYELQKVLDNLNNK